MWCGGGGRTDDGWNIERREGEAEGQLPQPRPRPNALINVDFNAKSSRLEIPMMRYYG